MRRKPREREFGREFWRASPPTPRIPSRAARAGSALSAEAPREPSVEAEEFGRHRRLGGHGGGRRGPEFLEQRQRPAREPAGRLAAAGRAGGAAERRPGGEEARPPGLEPGPAGAAARTRIEAGEAQEPSLEVGDHQRRRPIPEERLAAGGDQPVEPRVRLPVRGEGVHQFGEVAQSGGAHRIARERQPRRDQLAAVHIHEIPALAFEPAHLDFVAGVEGAAEPGFRPPHPAGPAAHLAFLAAEEHRDPVGLPDRVGAEHEAARLPEGHEEGGGCRRRPLRRGSGRWCRGRERARSPPHRWRW